MSHAAINKARYEAVIAALAPLVALHHWHMERQATETSHISVGFRMPTSNLDGHHFVGCVVDVHALRATMALAVTGNEQCTDAMRLWPALQRMQGLIDHALCGVRRRPLLRVASEPA